MILLNNQMHFGDSNDPASNKGISQETVIPSQNSDPPITLEQALELVTQPPDMYAVK